MIRDYCQYCHDASAMYCLNSTCDGNRKYVCKKCAIDRNCKCRDCGERLIDIAELDTKKDNR